MGSLPAPRINMSRAFEHTGVDYAGPIQMRVLKGRGNRSYKGYIAIFICLCTKAVHIEAVSDLTAQAFIAAFKRFVSRRGQINHIYSDNGTNFVSTNKILLAESKAYAAKCNSEIEEFLISNHMEWHYIPPASPHFGGLWKPELNL